MRLLLGKIWKIRQINNNVKNEKLFRDGKFEEKKTLDRGKISSFLVRENYGKYCGVKQPTTLWLKSDVRLGGDNPPLIQQHELPIHKQPVTDIGCRRNGLKGFFWTGFMLMNGCHNTNLFFLGGIFGHVHVSLCGYLRMSIKRKTPEKVVLKRPKNVEFPQQTIITHTSAYSTLNEF